MSVFILSFVQITRDDSYVECTHNWVHYTHTLLGITFLHRHHRRFCYLCCYCDAIHSNSTIILLYYKWMEISKWLRRIIITVRFHIIGALICLKGKCNRYCLNEWNTFIFFFYFIILFYYCNNRESNTYATYPYILWAFLSESPSIPLLLVNIYSKFRIIRDLRYVCAGTISPIYLFYHLSVSTEHTRTIDN